MGGGNLDRHHNPGANSGLFELHASGPAHVRESAPMLGWFRGPTVTSSVTSQGEWPADLRRSAI
jgi:hypothetical protein